MRDRGRTGGYEVKPEGNPSSTGPKRKPREREQDLLDITKLYVRGLTQREIAAEISEGKNYTLTYQTISRDIKEVLKR